MDLSVVIPVYNGGKTIPELCRKVKEELGANYTYEIIFVHDYGRDNSWPVITEIINRNPDTVRGFKLSKNYGQHNAILFGIKEAMGDFIITLDEDLQHNPAFISKLLKKQKEGDFDVVYARFKELKHPGLRIRTSELLRRVLKIIVPGIFPYYSPYRLLKRNVAKQITFLKNSYTFIDGYLGMKTESFGYIDAEHFKRLDGVSSYSYYKLFRHAIMIAFAYSPLKRWILTSALVFNALSIGCYLSYGIISGSSTIRILCMLSGFIGIILLLIGLIAEAIHYRGTKTNIMPVAFSGE